MKLTLIAKINQLKHVRVRKQWSETYRKVRIPNSVLIMSKENKIETTFSKVCGDCHELEACNPMLFATSLEGF